METRIIAKVNETNILVSSDDNYVPIRPICKAIGIDFASQLEKLKNDKTLAATIQVNPTVGADGKNREMICIHKKMKKLKKEIQQEERLLAQIRSDRLDRQQGVLLFNTEE